MSKNTLERLSYCLDEKERGFTLIELLVVILIIGILASIAIPAFMNQRKAANEATVKSDLANAAKVFETELVATKGKSYPTTMPDSVKISEGVELSLPTAAPASAIVSILAKDGYDTYSANVDFEGTATGYKLHQYVPGLDTSRLLKWTVNWKCSNGSTVTDSSNASALHVYPYYVEPYAATLGCAYGYSFVPGSAVIGQYVGDTSWFYVQGSTTLPNPATIAAPAPENEGFCINGTHENIDGKTFKYDSLNGGLQEGSC